MLYFFIAILNLKIFWHNFSLATNKQWIKLIIIILQNTEKNQQGNQSINQSKYKFSRQANMKATVF